MNTGTSYSPWLFGAHLGSLAISERTRLLVLDPQAAAVLAQMEAAGIPPLHELTPEAARTLARASVQRSDEPVFQITEEDVPGAAEQLSVRLYHPGGDELPPLIIFFHGGGWVLGDLDSQDALCRALANRVHAVVASVDYRLAPEHPFPAAVEDVVTATTHLVSAAHSVGADPGRVAVMGDSAGANLAAVVAQECRHLGIRLNLQVLVTPAVDLNFDRSSMHANRDGVLLTTPTLRWFWEHYLGSVHRPIDPKFAPLRADDLSGLAPALIVTAEHDPLRDEGAEYAARLAAAGVPTSHRDYEGMMHSFLGMRAHVDRANDAFDEVAEALERAFAEIGDLSEDGAS